MDAMIGSVNEPVFQHVTNNDVVLVQIKRDGSVIILWHNPGDRHIQIIGQQTSVEVKWKAN